MKVKNIFCYLIVAILALQLGACSNSEAEQKFDQTPTERLNAQKKELNDLLLSSEYGWKAIYFTDSTQLGGFTHLFKFLPNGKVDMASDFDIDTAIYNSQYEIQLGSTVSLVFTTANRIHLLSDSNDYPTGALRGKGFLGDFQFLYYGQEKGDVIFRTNRTVQELRFVKATAQDWIDIDKNAVTLQNMNGGAQGALFSLFETNDGTTVHPFDYDFNGRARFAVATSSDPTYAENYNMAFSYTATGAVAKPALVVKGQKLSNFIYDSAADNFVATGTGGVSATIKFTNTPLTLTDDYKILIPANANVVYGHDRSILEIAATNSSFFISLFKQIESSLPAGYTLGRIQPWFNTSSGSYVEYRIITPAGAAIRIYHFFTLTSDAQKRTITLNPTATWKQGSTFANAVPVAAPAFLKNMDDQLMNPGGLYVKKETFKVGGSNTVFTFTSATNNFRMTTWAFQ